jgi:hypothetical protein
MSEEFLLKEFECCYEQLRFYDTRSSDLLKYLFSLTSAVAAAQFAVYKLTESLTQGFFSCHAFLSMVVFVATALLYGAMLQNRLYFVYTAKQLNAIRGYLLTQIPDFKNNQLYTVTDFSAFKPRSVHTFQLIGAAFISSLFAASFVYSIPAAVGGKTSVAAGMIAFVVMLVGEVVTAVFYLGSKDSKNADEVIHGTGL